MVFLSEEPMDNGLSDRQLSRYARHVILDEVGEVGQEKLLSARVLVIGAGGLGSPVLLYLAAAGIGTLGIVDFDNVDLTNLQRQIIHNSDDIGQNKAFSAAEKITALNPEVTVHTYRTRLTGENAEEIFANYDVIVDGSDNFPTRYVVNDACIKLEKILVSAAILRFEGQLSTFKPFLGGPCYGCIFPKAPDETKIARCDTVGVFGVMVGIMGCLQATEVIKELLGLGSGLKGKLVMYDALSNEFRKIQISKNPNCTFCNPTKRG